MKFKGWVWFVDGKPFRTYNGGTVVWLTRKSGGVTKSPGWSARRATVTVDEPKKRGKKR